MTSYSSQNTTVLNSHPGIEQDFSTADFDNRSSYNITQIKANHQLSECKYADVRNVNARVVGDELLLTGKVTSYFHKQLAQEQVRDIAKRSGLQIVNKVTV